MPCPFSGAGASGAIRPQVTRSENLRSGSHGAAPRTGFDHPSGETAPTGKFGRLFPKLAPLVPDVAALDELADAMNEQGVRDFDAPEGDNPNLPAGYTYLGQFIDHDITFDTTTIQEALVDPLALLNFRTPMLDLDCLYGLGPAAQPYLYDRADPDLFLVGRTSANPGGGDSNLPVSQPFDLPRATHGFATIGDPRNDENLVVAQTHLLFLRFHNAVVTQIKDGTIQQNSPVRKTPFDEARDLVIWHYQWIVLHDFLGRLLTQSVLEEVLKNGPTHYKPGAIAFMPVEFSGAAYRWGHSAVRENYDYNRVFTFGGVVPASLELLFQFTGFSANGANVPIPTDWVIDWRRFYEVDAAVTPGHARLIDPLLSPKLHNLPSATDIAGRPPVSENGGSTNDRPSLPRLNLRRGRSLGLPSAQSIAHFLGMEPLTPEELAAGPDGAVAAKHSFHIESPLWWYILKEAQVRGQGQRLGPVGSRILAEVFVGLLLADSSSFLVRQPQWRPTLPSKEPGHFTMADLVNFVGTPNPIGNRPGGGE